MTNEGLKKAREKMAAMRAAGIKPQPAAKQERTAEQQQKVDAYVENIPVSARNICQKAFAGEGGAMNAIRAKCLDCSCWQREEITYCRVFACPLWKWRPYQPGTGDSEPETAAI
jgi:hypothetical protein